MSAAYYESTYRCKGIGDECTTLEQLATRLEEEAKHVRGMVAAGVQLVAEVQDDYAHLLTPSPHVARKYGFAAFEPSFPQTKRRAKKARR